MNILIPNTFRSLQVALTVLYWAGLWTPNKNSKMYSYVYPATLFTFLLVIYIIAQFGDLCQVWGDVSLMTGTSFLLFTNMSFGLKIFKVWQKTAEITQLLNQADGELRDENSKQGKEIVKRWDREASVLLYCYSLFSYMTVIGWATSTVNNELPMRAWYPYDTSVSPAYEITFIHQVVGVFLGATVNVSVDFLMTMLMAQCSCRLQLLALTLSSLSEDMVVTDQKLFSSSQMDTIVARLRSCIVRHQAVLQNGARLQELFSGCIFVQVTVSMVIICITAFQLAIEKEDLVRFLAMMAYFLSMTLQLFIYCYRGDQLSQQSMQVAGAAYQISWHSCSSSIRRDLLLLMTRSQRMVRVSAAGYTTLSLSAFMSIMKASYSFFTVLRGVDDD